MSQTADGLAGNAKRDLLVIGAPDRFQVGAQLVKGEDEIAVCFQFQRQPTITRTV